MPKPNQKSITVNREFWIRLDSKRKELGKSSIPSLLEYLLEQVETRGVIQDDEE
ncbi:MAG: hypothetical protein KatS3mg003_1162 [Candidatus Nitrosocaldaceae archaeon]|nr:MAG: hypothetical protein KatS3mg003_1162 [Candidatus Nitrosocaldaceae archaeon]